MKKFVKPLRLSQADSVVKSFYRMLNGHPFIQWKDSIREVVER